MKQLLLVIFIAAAVYHGWQKFSGESILAHAPESPYVIVYGRNSCGWTSRMRTQLENAGIAFDYRIVDDRQVADDLHAKMESLGMDTRSYYLPVVEVSGRIFIRPDMDTVVNIYSEG
jgi:glutaredoxin